jgi:hypothetical protein
MLIASRQVESGMRSSYKWLGEAACIGPIFHTAAYEECCRPGLGPYELNGIYCVQVDVEATVLFVAVA